MINHYKRFIALCVTVAFLALLPICSLPAPAGRAASLAGAEDENAEPERNFVEREQQAGYQVRQKNVLPILLGIAAAAAGVFLVILLVSKDKYDITGQWRFHNHWTTAGLADFGSDWTFTSADVQIKTMGTYVRHEDDGSYQSGDYTIVNKNEVVFIGDGASEQYTGQFDSKTTMSGDFMLADGTRGTWTAEKK